MGEGAMPFLMSFALEPEIVTLAWVDNASVQFLLNIDATQGSTLPPDRGGVRRTSRSTPECPNAVN